MKSRLLVRSQSYRRMGRGGRHPPAECYPAFRVHAVMSLVLQASCRWHHHSLTCSRRDCRTVAYPHPLGSDAPRRQQQQAAATLDVGMSCRETCCCCSSTRLDALPHPTYPTRPTYDVFQRVSIPSHHGAAASDRNPPCRCSEPRQKYSHPVTFRSAVMHGWSCLLD